MSLDLGRVIDRMLSISGNAVGSGLTELLGMDNYMPAHRPLYIQRSR